jgi:lipopolysaccharide export system protein LptA
VDPRSIPKIARWAAAAAIGIVLVVAGILVHRNWLSSRAMRHEPAAVPASVEQQSLQFTFSKVDGQQTIFTIHAARATKYSGEDRSQLEDVDIVVYGDRGRRHDEIHTRSCDYEESSGAIVCHGKVDLELANAPVPGKPAQSTASRIEIETTQVHFDRKTGEATTTAPVEFRFPQGQGKALGVTYSSSQARITLGRDVELTLAPNRPGGMPAHIAAKGGLNYNRATGKLVLKGPVEITKGLRSLETAELTVTLNPHLHPRHALAEGGPTARWSGARPASLRADQAEIFFDSQGRADRVRASGNVVAKQQAASTMQVEALRADLTLDPLNEQPRQILAKGNVSLESRRQNQVTRLKTAVLELMAAPADRAAGTREAKDPPAGTPGIFRLERATTPGPAQAEWQSGRQQERLAAGRLAATFGAGNQIRVLRGAAGVRMERQEPNALPVTTTAESLVVDFAGGEWSNARESGNVRAWQGNRRALAERADWSRARDEMRLTGEAQVSDPRGQTLADTILWNQRTGAVVATGNVRSTYFAKAGTKSGLGPNAGPVNVVAEQLAANRATGEAVYSGGARLWQGSMMIQAARIELRRKTGQLLASGNVRGAFPQVQRLSRARKGDAGKAMPGTAELWRVEAQKLDYVNEGSTEHPTGGRATLEDGAKAWSSNGEIEANRLVLTMRRNAEGRAEITRAVGEGGVLVRQGKRWGRAQRGLYNAAKGQFILTGGKPSLHDTSGDLVTGSELTFYVANDTILVESKKGSRTLTRHPIQK